MTQTTRQETVERRLKEAIGMSGLLFQPHPDIGRWQTTRALAPEISAWHNKPVNFHRLAIEFHDAGIPDENGYVPQYDEYRVVAVDTGGTYGEQPAEAVCRTVEEAVEKVAEIMVEVTENQE